jgi:transketolase
MSSSSTERVLRADNSQRNEMAVALWHGNLRHNPANPMWADRDPSDVAAVSQAIAMAKESSDGPTLIVCRTTIGKGSPGRAGTAKAYGEPMGADQIRHAREAIGWPHGPSEVPAELRARWDAHVLANRPGPEGLTAAPSLHLHRLGVST